MDQDFAELFNLINDDEEELFDVIWRRPNNVRQRTNNFDKWDDDEFKARFRLSKQVVRLLLERIENQLLHQTNRNHAVPPLEQLLLTLRFFATGSFYMSLGDHSGIHKTTAGQIINRVCNALITLKDEYIYLPRDNNEVVETQQGFYTIARFPRVIGAIDCTHVRIQSPGGDQAENFRCRKGYFSINVQATCDSTLRITDVVARWPGAAHDSTIFNNSRLCARFEAGYFNNSLLLGDGGYQLRNYLITPLPEPANDAERLFNEAQIRTRNTIERVFGIWKRRFPVLSVGLRCKIVLAQKIILATAIVHNIAIINHEDPPPEIDEGNDDEEQNNDRLEVNGEEINVRRELIDYFASLL